MSNTEALRTAAANALDVLDEARTYTSSEAWSPSMTEECDRAIRLLQSALAQPAASGGPVAQLVATELERLAQDPPISGNTLAQTRVLMTAANVREFGLAGGATAQPAPAPADIAAKLRDPVAVHAAMLRGEIATPAIRDMLHVYGADALARWDNAQPAPAPPGWVMVPVEPTPQMLQASLIPLKEAARYYTRMLAAAPGAPDAQPNDQANGHCPRRTDDDH